MISGCTSGGESYKGDFKVYLEDKDGNLNSNVLAFGSITDEWKKYEGRLKALRRLRQPPLYHCRYHRSVLP